MSLEKMTELAEKFTIKLAEHQYEEQAPEDVKASDIIGISQEELNFINKMADIHYLIPKKPSLKERSQLKGHGPSNLLVDDNAVVDEKIWQRAKKVVKKYWNKYDEPWAVVYDVYRKMGGKSKKSKKKKSNLDINALLHKYATGARPSWWNEPDPEPIYEEEELKKSPEEIAQEAAQEEARWKKIKYIKEHPEEDPVVRVLMEEVAKWEDNLANVDSNSWGQGEHALAASKRHCMQELEHYKKRLAKALHEVKMFGYAT